MITTMDGSNNSNGIVGIHLLSPNITGVNLGRSVNLLLVSQLAEVGYRTAFIPKSNYSFGSDSVPAVRGYFAAANSAGDGLVISKTPATLPLGPAVDAIQVVRARTASPAQLETTIPVVNGHKLRVIGADKWAQYLLLRDYMPQTVLTSGAEDSIPDLLEQIPTSRVVVKAINGRDGKLLSIVDKPQATQAVADIRTAMAEKGLTKASILLQAYQPGVAFTMVRGAASDDMAAISALPHDAAAELRVYCFGFWSGREVQLETYAVYRVLIGSPAEAFIVIDQASVPPEAFRIAEFAARRIIDHSGALGGLIAVDEIVRADGTIGIREINTRDPALAGLVSQNHDFQVAQVARLVRLLVGLAQEQQAATTLQQLSAH